MHKIIFITYFLGVAQTALPSRFSRCFFHLRCMCRSAITGQWRSHTRSVDVRSIFVWRGGVWRICHRPHHIEHSVVTFVCHSWVQKSTANTPRTLAPTIETTHWSRFSFLRPCIISIAKLPFLQFRLFFLPFFSFFFIVCFIRVFRLYLILVFIFLFALFLYVLFSLFCNRRLSFTYNLIIFNTISNTPCLLKHFYRIYYIYYNILISMQFWYVKI